MAHTGQERYSKLVLAKLRASAVLKDGIVFNNDYEGDPKAGAVKIPVRDTEVAVSDYDKAAGLTGATGTTTYMTITIDKDKAVNEIIDGYDAEAVPDGIVAERLDSAGYALAMQLDNDGAAALLDGGTAVTVDALTKDTAYAAVVQRGICSEQQDREEHYTHYKARKRCRQEQQRQRNSVHHACDRQELQPHVGRSEPGYSGHGRQRRECDGELARECDKRAGKW